MKGLRKYAVLQAACLLMTGGAVMLPAAQETAMIVSAADYTEEEYEGFTVRKYETYAEIVKYTGDKTEVVIPDHIDGRPVLSIVSQLFSFPIQGKVTSVIIPNTMLNICRSAFSNCSCLESIVIPDSVTEIGDYIFSGCSSL